MTPDTGFQAVSVNYWAIMPILVVFGGALVGVLVEAFVPRRSRHSVQVALTLITLATAFAALVTKARHDKGVTLGGALVIDGPALFQMGAILVLGILSVMLMAEKFSSAGADAFTPMGAAVPGSKLEATATRAGWGTGEVFPLALFSIAGMMIFPAAGDLLTMFVALEVMSLPLYLLVAMSRRRRLLSQEASLKYFLLGAFGSAFFLYGSAMTYGFAGTLGFGGIASKMTALAGPNGLLITGIGLIAVGLLFKLGAVPFHQWVPDVYQGAPTPLTGFMAAAVKLAAFGALLRIMYVAFGGARWDWRPAFWIIAVLTMLVGVILALTQNDVKRMLAYSSIAHAGFLLIGVLATNNTGLGGTMFYLLAYGVSTIGAFALVALVRDPAGEATSLSSWVGLGRTSPLVAGAFALFLLAFAGIPLTSGFTSKFYVFTAGIAGGATPVVIFAVIASAIAVFFYGRVIVLMFFTKPKGEGPSVVVPSTMTAISIGFAVAFTVLLGVVPQAMLDVAEKASTFIR